MTVQQATGAVPEWTLGDRLRKARVHAGLDQHELAERVGIARNSVGNYETDRTTAKPLAVWMWAQVCGVDPVWLATGYAEPPPEGSDGRDLWQKVTQSEQICTVVTFPQVRPSAPARYAA